ncbi:putative lipase atg15 [Tulasnella sp. 330]|nr:putative lipase atg15 [Tulasnella sp. 330]
MLLSTICTVFLLASSFIAARAEGGDAYDLHFDLAYDYGEATASNVLPETLPGIAPIHGSGEPLIIFNSRKSHSPPILGQQGDKPELIRPDRIRARPMRISRPRSNPEFQRARLHSMRHSQNLLLDWETIDVLGPDIEDRITLLELAKVTGNAYALNISQPNWYPLDPKWNTSIPFGWGIEEDGFRGHVFVTADNSTVILSIKGTTLSGATFGAPVVAFESPGERLAAERLHLPITVPSPYTEVSTYHVYHTADPIPSGACTGVHSLCASGGYALETRCHLGKTILYDTIGKLGWGASLRKHTIKTIVTQVLNEDWEDVSAGGRAVPEAVYEEDCIECFKWEFGDYKKPKGLSAELPYSNEQEVLSLVSDIDGPQHDIS